MNTTVRGLVWVVLGGLTFVFFIAAIRFVGTDLNPIQSAFIRYAFAIILVVPVFLRHGPGLLRTRRLGRHGVRGFCHALGVLLWFYAITRIPIAEATALSYVSPLFVTVGAVLILGERYTTGRVVAVLIGLGGIMLILRPGFVPVGPGAMAVLLSAPLFAASKLLVKNLVAEDDSVTTVIYLSIFATLTMLVPALYVWQTPSLVEVVLLCVAALFATVSHYCQARGLKLVDVTVAQPAEFLMLVWATLLGILLFDETPSAWIWFGAGVVVFSVWLSSRDRSAQPEVGSR